MRKHTTGSGGWSKSLFKEPEGILLASNVLGAKGYLGDFEGPIGDMGACEHLDLANLTPVEYAPGKVWAGNVTHLHESIPVDRSCYRQLVRLNVAGWTPN